MDFYGPFPGYVETDGCILNQTESSVLVRGSGAKFLRWKKQHLVFNKNQAKCLSLATEPESFYLPVAKKCLYIGCVMSYDNFEMQTLKMRVATGWNQFRRRFAAGRKCM